jgi:hypothetical protein
VLPLGFEGLLAM